MNQRSVSFGKFTNNIYFCPRLKQFYFLKLSYITPMYQSLKQVVKKILPTRLLFKFEPFIRFFLWQFYRGNRFRCNVCNKGIRSFIEMKNGDKLCPRCGSLSRNRRTWEMIAPDIISKELTVLDFSPSRTLYRVMKSNLKGNYYSSDLSGDFISDYQFDITKIDTEDNRFDLVICYHILEHVIDDLQAMRELHRVTKKGGLCLIQTPFKEGEVYEDLNITSEQERLIHFGQIDHVRIYSVESLRNRLTECGFLVEVKEFSELENNKFGFHTQEVILICKA